jgi:hypothetical protein
MEQLIRRQGRAFDIGQEQRVELEGFFHGDPASMQSLIARSDEELMYALRIAKVETLDGPRAHALARHGPDVTDAKLERRVTTGIAPDGAESKTRFSTRFSSYQNFWETRELAFEYIGRGLGDPSHPVNLSEGPGIGLNTLDESYVITLEHINRHQLSSGYRGVGTPVSGTFGTTAVTGSELTRTLTRIRWNASEGRWFVVQHWPDSRNFDFVTSNYTNTDGIIVP